MKNILRTIVYLFMIPISISCYSQKKINSVEFCDGYYIAKYIYRYDSVVADTSFWPQEVRLVANGANRLLAGPISNFRSVFKCNEYDKLIKYAGDKELNKLKDSIDRYHCFYSDSISKDMYFIAPVKGDFIYLTKSLCKDYKGSPSIYSEKRPCKYAPKLINKYPFFVSISYSYTGTIDLNKAKIILANPNLVPVVPDQSRFQICY